MQTKLVEIHDDGMKVLVLAIKMTPTSAYERQVFFDRLGFRPDGGSIILIELDSMVTTSDPFHWPSLAKYPRTLPSAHKWIIDNFEQMLPGEIININMILGAEINPDPSDL